MSLSGKIGCCSLLMGALACIVCLCRHAKDYEFEFCIYGRVPDLDRYAVIEAKVQNWYRMPYGYALYRSAMRESGIGSFVLTDRMACQEGSFFGGGHVTPNGIAPWDGDSGFFGELPKIDFPGHSNVVAVIQNTKSCQNAIMAIETNAILQCRWPFRDAPQSFNVMDEICCWSGIGVWPDGPYGNHYHGTTRDMAKMEAKEAITACAIKAAFPKIRMPRIDELTPDEEKRVIIHGRAPLPVRAKLVAQRKFDFFAEDGHLYASLRIKPAYDFHGCPVNGFKKIYTEIFRQVFAELKNPSRMMLIRGKVNYDNVNDVVMVHYVERTPIRK